LYLGGLVDGAADPEAVKRIEVSAVVCCVTYAELPKRREVKGLEYFRVDVDDASHEPIKSYFQETIEFIANKIHRDERVLVHCRSGVSRSATIVLAFVVHHLQISVHDAFFLVRSKRPVIMPNLGFMDQLCEYEVELDGAQGDPTIDTYKYMEWYTSADPSGVPDLANEVDDAMFVGIPDAYPVIEGLSHRVSTLVAAASDGPRARDDTSIVTKQDTEAVAGRARSLSPLREDDGGAAINLSSLRLEASPTEQRNFGAAEWSFQLETACEEKDLEESRVDKKDRRSPDGSPFSTPTRHRSPSVGGIGLRRATSTDLLRGSSHLRKRSSDLPPTDPALALSRRQTSFNPPRQRGESMDD
jgi:hypothetical protein